MARPKKPEDEIMIEIPCKVPREAYSAVAALAHDLDRSKSAVARKLFLHGLAAIQAGMAYEELEDPYKTRKTKPGKGIEDLKSDGPDAIIETAAPLKIRRKK